MYILDTGNSRIQRWVPGASYGTTVVSASMSNPYGLTMDRLNNLVVADCYQHRIVSFGVSCRKLSSEITSRFYKHNFNKFSSSATVTTTTTIAPSK